MTSRFSILDCRLNGRQVSHRGGMVLYAVLVIAAMASMVAGSLLFRMRAERMASAGAGRGRQAWAAAMSGLDQAVAALADSGGQIGIHDNPDIFRHQFVSAEGGEKWYFTIYARGDQEPTEPRYGVTDLAGLINVNVARRETLLAMPNMTEELVDCLLDYRDRDDEPRENGAEQEQYNDLDPPQAIRNGFFLTLEELLLVKGFGGPVVYGDDANLNGLLEANEDDGEETHPEDDGDGALNAGLRGLATVTSYEPNVNSAGAPRININGDFSERDLQAAVGRTTAEFIQLFRRDGNTFRHPSDLLKMSYVLKKTHGKDDRRGKTISSGVRNGSQLAGALDNLTTSDAKVSAGLVNVNSAPVEVLSALLGPLDANLADQIVASRRNRTTEDPARTSPGTAAWLYAEKLVGAEKFKQIAPLLTGRGFQYRVQVVGYGVTSGQFRVLEAIVDLAGGSPQIVYLRDLTRLGLPFALAGENEEVRG